MEKFFDKSLLLEKINGFIPEYSFLGKCYCMSECRNQWIDWRGTTKRRGTYYPGYFLTINEIKQSCESSRKRGSSFEIVELPLFVFESKIKRFCFSFSGLCNTSCAKDFVESLGVTENIFESIKSVPTQFQMLFCWGDIEYFPQIDCWFPNDDLFTRRSSAGKLGYSLVWTCTKFQLDRKLFWDRLCKYALASR